MSIIQKASLVLAFLVVVGAVPMRDAQAASSVLGPTVCVADGSSSTTPSLVYTTDGVANNSGVPAMVLCTLFRDNTSNTNGLQALQITITDKSSVAGTFRCDAFSLDRYGQSKAHKFKTSSTVGNSVLDFGSTLNVSVSKGYYSLECSLPAFSSLHSIYYVEP